MQGYVTVFLLLEQKLRATFMDNFEPYQKWGIFVGYILNSNIFMYVYEIACVHQTKEMSHRRRYCPTSLLHVVRKVTGYSFNVHVYIGI